LENPEFGPTCVVPLKKPDVEGCSGHRVEAPGVGITGVREAEVADAEFAKPTLLVPELKTPTFPCQSFRHTTIQRP
jgi:hypothetical protein